MPLPQRAIGDGQASAIGLGFGSISGFYGPAGSLDERVALLDHAHATGLRFWDTSDIYGDSEEVISEWIKRSPSKREDVVLATKFALHRQENGTWGSRSDPEYVKSACEKSLKRLGVETIDLYYCHRVDGVTPIEKTIEAMVELKKEGKIRHIGLSEVSAATLRRAHAIHPISALQMEYSLFLLDIETSEILKTCRELGVTVVAYSPIGRGILTGQIQSHSDIPEGDLRRFYPKYAEGNFPEIMKLVQKLKDVANAHGNGTTPGQVALAWLLAQGADIIPIPGTKSTARMDENAAAALLELTDQEVQDIRSLAESIEVEGTRYPAAVMASLCSDTPPLQG